MDLPLVPGLDWYEMLVKMEPEFESMFLLHLIKIYFIILIIYTYKIITLYYVFFFK